MNSTSALTACSLGMSGGVALVVSGWTQPTPSLRRILRGLHRRGHAVDPLPLARAREAVVEFARAHPRVLPAETDLRRIGRSVELHVVYVLAGAAAGLVVPGLAVLVLQWTGVIGLTWFAPVVAGVVGVVVGALVVQCTAIEAARKVGTDLRYQLSALLDVVTMLLAGNAGYEGAIEYAARAGDGLLFSMLRHNIRESGAIGATLTTALADTGSQLGLDELVQIAAMAALSAGEGSPIARTLAARCSTLRAALAADLEAEARLRTSRLTTPIVGMALIFMALVIYPALGAT